MEKFLRERTAGLNVVQVFLYGVDVVSEAEAVGMTENQEAFTFPASGPVWSLTRQRTEKL